MLQNVLTLINRLCITICLKFYQCTILAITLTTKAWAPKKILHIMRKSPPPAHRVNGTQKKKKNPLYEKSLPLPTIGRKKSQNRLFSRGTRQAPTLAAPLRAPMNECDYKIYNIYLTMHPIELFFKKNSWKSIPLNPLAMKLNNNV